VKCVVETTGKEHADHIIASLKKKYPITREDP
jgi:disulfide oxidoreductase YuzD